jgi:hypothetical protein
MPVVPLSRVVVDSNVLMDLGAEVGDVVDACTLIRQRLPNARFLLAPTPRQELAHLALHGETARERKAANDGITAAHAWRMQPAMLTPVEHGIVERVAEALRRADLLPASEVNDSLLVAEAAMLEARLLLSSDEHLRGMDHARLAFVLQSFDLLVPVIATPREVVRKFLPR